MSYDLIVGLVVGSIVMAGVYNGALYLFNRKQSFLYYAIMEFFIALALLDKTDVIEGLLSIDNKNYYFTVSLISTLFLTLFSYHFFNLKHHRLLKRLFAFIVIILLVDILLSLVMHSFLFTYKIILLFALVYIYVALRGIKQGFKPALFYLIAWCMVLVASLLDAFQFESYFLIDPILVASVLEAVLFSLALSLKVKMLADEKDRQKELLIQQHKLASMGELLGNISHQWRQPLTSLSYTLMNIEDAKEFNELSPEYLSENLKDANKQIAFMSQTIDDFRSFYAPSKTKEPFLLSDVVNETVELINNVLAERGIVLTVTIKDEKKVVNYKNEYKQVLLNLLTNAKDILHERNIPSPQITIEIKKSFLILTDNGGGVDSLMSEHIFEPYFTTKERGTGIGLYMSKIMIEKNMKGELLFHNHNGGATFTIKI
jgi:signal transduction histidine kinase